jgi:hypothetical protein
MTLEEFTDYVLALSAQVAGEPAASPIMDAGMIVEFLLPAVLREAVRNAFKNDRYLETLIKEHKLTISNGMSALPAGLEEEFSRSFQVSIGELRSRVLAGTWNSATKQFTVTGVGNVSANDVGMLAVVKDSGGVQRASGYLASAVSPTVALLDVSAGVGSFAGSTMTLYSTSWAPLKSLTSVGVSAFSQTVTINNGGGYFLPEDDGNLIKIYTQPNAAVLRLTSIISQINDPMHADMFDVNPGPDDVDTGSAVIYQPVQTRSKIGLFTHYPHYAEFLGITGEILPRFCVRDGNIFFKDANDAEIADGTFMYVQGVTVPQVPTLSTDEIPVTEPVLDECMAIVASIIRGERSLQSVGIDPEKAQ